MAISSSPDRSKVQSFEAATTSIMSTGLDWRPISNSMRLMRHLLDRNDGDVRDRTRDGYTLPETTLQTTLRSCRSYPSNPARSLPAGLSAVSNQIGRATVRTTVTNAQLVWRLLPSNN